MRLTVKRAGTSDDVPLWESAAEAWPDHDGMIYAYGQVLGDEHWMHFPGLASFRFNSRGDDVAAALTRVEAEDSIRDIFHRRVLPMAIQVRGREVLHASAIRGPKGVVTFCGTAHSGKSTIAFGLDRRGYSLWADDMVAFEFSEGQPRAVSLPFQPRLRKPSADLFAVKTDNRTVPGYELAPVGTHTAEMGMVCVLRAQPNIGPEVAIRRLAFADALTTILDHACFFSPQSDSRKRVMVQHYLDLVAHTPVFEICFRKGLENLGQILDAVEALIGSPGHET